MSEVLPHVAPSDPGGAAEAALAYHEGGKLGIRSRVPLEDRADLCLAYTPGVAAACRAIAADPSCLDRYSSRANLVAVVTDGSAVLGLGDLGPAAALPVMEGKCLLLGRFGGVDAVPLCLAGSRDPGSLAEVIAAVAPGFGAIQLEDVSAPRCFDLEERLRKTLSIPVFHDDQHGTAVVVAAALRSALRATGRQASETRVVVNGAGAAGCACAELLLDAGVGDVVLCDRSGIVRRPVGPDRAELAARCNRLGLGGDLAAALQGADVLVGVSAAGVVSRAMVRSMARRPIVFALANPDPEIDRGAALEAGAAIVATGASDDPNQLNNALCFPGFFRGLLDAGATGWHRAALPAAADAIAGLVTDEELGRGIVVPDIFHPAVAPAVAGAVAEAAWAAGLASRALSSGQEAAAARTRVATWVRRARSGA